MAEEGDSSGESTDALSEKFDSFKALYSKEVRLLVPEAPLFDNVSKFESVVINQTSSSEQDSKQQQRREGGNTQIEPIETSSNEKQRQRYQSEKNVISKMQKAYGPLAALYQYMESRTRIKFPSNLHEDHKRSMLVTMEMNEPLAPLERIGVIAFLARGLLLKSRGEEGDKVIAHCPGSEFIDPI